MSDGNAENRWEAAQRTLAEAVKLPWGPERIEALRRAALMRLEATKTPELQSLVLGKRFGNRAS